MFSSSIGRAGGGGFVLARDCRVACDDVAIVIRYQKKAVGDLDRGSVFADEDVDAVTVSPESPYLHSLQIARLAEIAHDVSADHGIALPTDLSR